MIRRTASWRILALAGASFVAVAGALAGVPLQTLPAAGGAGVPNGQVAVTAGDTGNGLGTDVAQMPYGLAVAPDGEIYISDFSDPAAVEPDPAPPGNETGDSVIRVLNPGTDGEQVVAGDGDGAPQNLLQGTQSVAATDSSLDDPAGMALDPTNESLVFDEPGLNVVTRYTPPSGTDPGTLSQVCSTDGADTAAGGDAAVDSHGNVVIPIIGGTGVEVWAAQTGTFWGEAMTAGNDYTIPTLYSDPWAVAIDAHDNLLVSSSGDSLDVLAGSTGTFYGQAMTVGNWYHLAGEPTTNSGDAGFGGDGGPATSALIGAPHGISLDSSGNILLADTDNNRIRVIAEWTGTFYGIKMTAGDIYTVAGSGSAPSQSGSFGGDGGAATSAELNQPTAVVADESGNLVIADNGNFRVRVVAESTGAFYGVPMTQNDIYTVAGNGWSSYSGDGGSPTSAQLGNPQDVSFDSAGNELIADSANGRIRVVAGSTGTFYDASMTAGDIYTVAGEAGAVEANLGDAGPATSAELNDPGSVRSDGDGNLLIADTGDNQIRVVAGASGTQYGVSMTRGDIYTIAGNGTQGSSGDDWAATSAELDAPQSAILDGYGNVVIADTGNNRVRVVAESTGTFYGIAMTQGDIYTDRGHGHRRVQRRRHDGHRRRARCAGRPGPRPDWQRRRGGQQERPRPGDLRRHQPRLRGAHDRRRDRHHHGGRYPADRGQHPVGRRPESRPGGGRRARGPRGLRRRLRAHLGPGGGLRDAVGSIHDRRRRLLRGGRQHELCQLHRQRIRHVRLPVRSRRRRGRSDRRHRRRVAGDQPNLHHRQLPGRHDDGPAGRGGGHVLQRGPDRRRRSHAVRLEDHDGRPAARPEPQPGRDHFGHADGRGVVFLHRRGHRLGPTATVGDAGAVDGRPAVRHVHHHHRGRQRREDGYDDHGRLVADGDGGGAALRGDGRQGGQHRLHRRR